MKGVKQILENVEHGGYKSQTSLDINRQSMSNLFQIADDRANEMADLKAVSLNVMNPSMKIIDEFYSNLEIMKFKIVLLTFGAS